MDFKIPGALFDVNLRMTAMVKELIPECRWKIGCILKLQRFHSKSDLLHFFKANVWSYLEYRTAAICHCHQELSKDVDDLQNEFLAILGIPSDHAVMEHNFLPLSARRDIAMLGLTHRANIGRGPPHFRKFFKRAQNSSKSESTYTRPPYVIGPWHHQLPCLRNSALGLIPV